MSTEAARFELARRVTASEREYLRLADDCWKAHDYLTAIRYRGVAEGLAVARDHHLTVAKESRDAGEVTP